MMPRLLFHTTILLLACIIGQHCFTCRSRRLPRSLRVKILRGKCSMSAAQLSESIAPVCVQADHVWPAATSPLAPRTHVRTEYYPTSPTTGQPLLSYTLRLSLPSSLRGAVGSHGVCAIRWSIRGRLAPPESRSGRIGFSTDRDRPKLDLSFITRALSPNGGG